MSPIYTDKWSYKNTDEWQDKTEHKMLLSDSFTGIDDPSIGEIVSESCISSGSNWVNDDSVSTFIFEIYGYYTITFFDITRCYTRFIECDIIQFWELIIAVFFFTTISDLITLCFILSADGLFEYDSIMTSILEIRFLDLETVSCVVFSYGFLV